MVAADVRGNGRYDVATTGVGEAARSATATAAKQVKRVATGEPWAGYDELTVAEIRAEHAHSDDAGRAAAVRDYERAHKKRAGVLALAERELSNA